MKVVITDYQYPNIDQEKRIIAEAGFELFDYQYKDEENLIRVCRDADAIIVQYAEITKSVIDTLQNCKMIIKYGIGVNNIDVDAASQKGIYVCNCPDYGIDEVANHAIALLFSLIKKLPIIQKAFRSGDWGNSSLVPLYRLSGQKLGLVGLGRIPMSVAKKMAGFNVEILGYDPYLSQEAADQAGIKLVDFDTLCRECDIISIHCPLVPETTHIFNKDTFSKMKKSAFLINTARGPVINEQDLIEALEQGQIAGAGLDVFEKEPLEQTSKLLQMDNVICTPHIAWYSEEAINNLQKNVALEVVNTLKTNNPWNAVNKNKL
ncbi:MAG: C-terminal binding protein [Angelakisella sp.]|nr:C-terminal binding protein [Angelakisella sp.]